MYTGHCYRNGHCYRSYTQFCTAFLFSPDLIKILLVNVSYFETGSQGGLMLVSMWTDVNALIQNKFRSAIDLLNQHLLA